MHAVICNEIIIMKYYTLINIIMIIHKNISMLVYIVIIIITRVQCTVYYTRIEIIYNIIKIMHNMI